MGKMDIADIAKYSNSADIFLMSSYSEGIPTAMLEAMVFGLPVVSTAVGGIPSLITPSVNGFLVESRDPDEFIRAIEKAMGLDRTEVRQYNEKLIQTQFSARSIIGRMDQLIKEAIR